MYRRPHHLQVAKVLSALNCRLLQDAGCYFGGGTAIVLLLDEYRESRDVDFLCSSADGFRLLRNTVTENSLGALLSKELPLMRSVRSDQYGIRTVLEVDQVPIKLEFLHEGRLTLSGELHPSFGVPTLGRSDMYAEKLLANADRGLDKSVRSRDAIDLAMMIEAWGDIPAEAIHKSYAAYGKHVVTALEKTIVLIQDHEYFASCIAAAQMDDHLAERIPAILAAQLLKLQ